MEPARILVVDDDAFVRRLATALLQKDGHVVTEAASAEDGLARLAEETPDLLLVDIEMPGMTGLDLLRELDGRLPFPVILLSGNAPGDALPPGVTDYIVKPFAPQDFGARVHAALGG